MDIKKIIEHAENEIAEGSRGRQYIIEDVVNAVIDLVANEVGKKKYPSEGEAPITYTTADPTDQTSAILQHVYNQAIKDISTIIDNLRV